MFSHIFEQGYGSQVVQLSTENSRNAGLVERDDDPATLPCKSENLILLLAWRAKPS